MLKNNPLMVVNIIDIIIFLYTNKLYNKKKQKSLTQITCVRLFFLAQYVAKSPLICGKEPSNMWQRALQIAGKIHHSFPIMSLISRLPINPHNRGLTA
jgi:hypothetical protein